MKRAIKFIQSTTLVIGLCGCSFGLPLKPRPLTPIEGNELFRVSFSGAPSGTCGIIAPNSVVTLGKFGNVDVVTLFGGIKTSTIYCITDVGRVQTTAHISLVSPEVKSLELIGVGVVEPGFNRVSGTSVQTNGTFSIRGNLLWELVPAELETEVE